MTPTLDQLNALTNAGIISDNAVSWADVAQCDQERALQRLDFQCPAISVKQPWAWLIIHGGKDIENRDWITKVRGRVLIHASKGMTKQEYEDAEIFACSDAGYQGAFPEFDALQRGGIVGSVEIVDCVDLSDSPWFVGKYGFVLKEPRQLPFTQVNGQLGFFLPKLSEQTEMRV